MHMASGVQGGEAFKRKSPDAGWESMTHGTDGVELDPDF
jgi:hypothetical protein